LRATLRRLAGDLAGARQDAETSLRLSPAGVRPLALAQLAGLDLARGDSAGARSRLAELEAASFDLPIAHALTLALLGMHDRATAVLARGPVLPIDWSWLRLMEFDPLRALPGYARAVEPWVLPRPRS